MMGVREIAVGVVIAVLMAVSVLLNVTVGIFGVRIKKGMLG